MERVEVGRNLDSRHGVGNVGLDRGRVDVVVDHKATRMQTDNRLECKPTTAMAMANAKQQSHTVFGVAVECGLAITIGHGLVASARDKTMSDPNI